MALKNFLLAGFGGQGILFSGKVIAYSGLMDGKEVSWLPSYGPEMRGGTANWSVCISDEPIGSPLVLSPDVLMAMNLQSFDKFINTVVPGGIAVIDSTLVDKKTERTDITPIYVPATALASENDLQGLANIILIGTIFKYTQFADFEAVKKAIDKCVPPRKRHLIEANLRAIELGMKY